jgi:hypothetical protein
MTIYLVTYATHEKGYFPILKASCPEVIVLGMGEKWEGFYSKVHAVVEFCKTKSDKDIVCFMDGFDCVCLSNAATIKNKFLEFDCDILFSKDSRARRMVTKYMQDKFFGTCESTKLNSGIYMGYAKSIIKYWQGMTLGEDDQIFATRMCQREINNNNFKIEIDSSNRVFYNYSPVDDIQVSDGKLMVNGNNPCIIQAAGVQNINTVLESLGYKNLPNLQYDYNYRIMTYGGLFLPELILLVICGIIAWKSSNKWIAICVSLFLFYEFIHYEVYVKHFDRPVFIKILYMIFDVIHNLVFLTLIYLMFNFECNIQKLILLNGFYGFVLLSFFWFKMCILTIIENWILGVDGDTQQFGLFQRIQYLFDLDKGYVPKRGDNEKAWITANKYNIGIITMLNLYCLWKIRNKSCGCTKSLPYTIFSKGRWKFK